MKLIYPQLDGAGTPADVQRVQIHLLGCPACREAFQVEREFLDLLHRNPPHYPAPFLRRSRPDVPPDENLPPHSS